jgi:hypothetical protein
MLWHIIYQTKKWMGLEFFLEPLHVVIAAMAMNQFLMP